MIHKLSTIKMVLLLMGAFIQNLRAQEGSLREAAQHAGINLGCVQAWDKKEEAILSKHFNGVVDQNSCKMAQMLPAQGQPTYEKCDATAEFSRANNMKLRLHTLIWGSAAVPGFCQSKSPEQLKQIYVDHITQVMKHYCSYDNIIGIDVVNEALSDSQADVNKSPLHYNTKNEVWAKIPDYIGLAFKTARAACPTAKLFYNDYTLYTPNKFTALLHMLQDFKERGIPIDGIGFQQHLGVFKDPIDTNPSKERLLECFQKIGEFGLEVQITEYSVNCEGDCTTNQTPITMKNIEACVESPNCNTFFVWGLHTYFATGPREDSPVLLNKDGSLNHNGKAIYNYLMGQDGKAGASISDTVNAGAPTNKEPSDTVPPGKNAPVNSTQNAPAYPASNADSSDTHVQNFPAYPQQGQPDGSKSQSPSEPSGTGPSPAQANAPAYLPEANNNVGNRNDSPGKDSRRMPPAQVNAPAYPLSQSDKQSDNVPREVLTSPSPSTLPAKEQNTPPQPPSPKPAVNAPAYVSPLKGSLANRTTRSPQNAPAYGNRDSKNSGEQMFQSQSKKAGSKPSPVSSQGPAVNDYDDDNCEIVYVHAPSNDQLKQ
ncbi:hypothetical protein MP228_004384 [Amoeboaphelidium protococcarum]|nr:hypothetical protein MP228_004384 [Amoeboaphelidium protococcarum]